MVSIPKMMDGVAKGITWYMLGFPFFYFQKSNLPLIKPPDLRAMATTLLSGKI
jgi:hypothetical protein